MRLESQTLPHRQNIFFICPVYPVHPVHPVHPAALRWQHCGGSIAVAEGLMRC
jgi:hypothetical protein